MANLKTDDHVVQEPYVHVSAGMQVRDEPTNPAELLRCPDRCWIRAATAPSPTVPQRRRSQLERVSVGAGAVEQVNDSRSVTAVYGRPQGSALLLGVHLALRSLALPKPWPVRRGRGPKSN